MSSLLELIGQFVAVLVAAAFMHFGAMISEAVDKDATSTTTATATSEVTQVDAPQEVNEQHEDMDQVSTVKNTPVSDNAKSQSKVAPKS